MTSSVNQRNELFKKIQLSGVTIKQEALNILETEFKNNQSAYESVDVFISLLISTFLKIDCADYVIDTEVAQKAIDALKEIRKNENSNKNYHENKIIVTNADVTENINKNCVQSHFIHHYNQLVKYVKKLPVFESGQFSLTTVDDLNIYDSTKELKCVLFAMIRPYPCRIMQYLLEDATGKIPVSFSSEVVWREWAIFQNGIYLIEAIYHRQNDSLIITSIGSVPPMKSILPKCIQPNNDILSVDNEMIILLIDIHLDDSYTMNALKFLFAGYECLDKVPDCFILIGDFVSKPTNMLQFKNLTKSLIKLICTFEKIRNSTFIFVPGPNDPTDSIGQFKSQFNSEHFSNKHLKTNYKLATNPFSLRIGNKNVCFLVNKLLQTYVKNIIYSKEALNTKILSKDEPAQLLELFKAISRLMISNVHLTCAIDTNFLKTFSLFPQLPDLIIMADPDINHHVKFNPFEQISIQFATSVSFSKNMFKFLVYYANSNELEESQVNC